MDVIDELLTRGVETIIPNKEQLRTELLKRKLNIYFGIDPTAPNIHLGHTVPLRKLQYFAKEGHNITFLIGDFTAFIGDTSDKDAERKLLSSQEIKLNFQTYKSQAKKIVNFSLPNIKIVYNSKWLKNLNFSDIVELCQHFSVGEFIGRDSIKNRLNQNKRVGLQEVLYPVMQGQDSYWLKTDLQIGGTDQIFNMQAGRTLIKDLDRRDSFAMTTMILPGTDGRKMSKTLSNVIWLEDSPFDMYKKIMSIPDDVITTYYELVTNFKNEHIKDIKSRIAKSENPIIFKKELAFEIVKEFHNKIAADQASLDFQKTVQDKELPTEIPTYVTNIPYRPGLKVNVTNPPLLSSPTITDAVVFSGMVPSRSEAKRVIEQGGVTYDGKTVTDPNQVFIPKDGAILQKGKHTFRKIKTK